MADFPLLLSHEFSVALLDAARIHRTQARKGTRIPYVAHVLAVSSIVLEYGGTEVEAIGALFHDAVEDQPTQVDAERVAQDIRERYGDAVFAIVKGCTDTDIIPKPPWRERKEAYIAHAAHAPASVKIVSAADKLHNARAIVSDLRELGERLWPRFNASKEEIAWYYGSLVTAFRQGEQTDGLRRLVNELALVVEEMTSGPRRAPAS